MAQAVCEGCGAALDHGEVFQHNRVWIPRHKGKVTGSWVSGYWEDCSLSPKPNPLMAGLERDRDGWRDRTLLLERALERILAIIKEVDLKENPPA